MPVKSPSATPHPLQTVPWGQCWRKTEVTEDGFVVQEEILPPTGTLRPPTTKPGGVSSIQAKCKDEVSPVMWGQTELNNHVRRKTVCFQGAGASLDLFDCGFVKMNNCTHGKMKMIFAQKLGDISKDGTLAIGASPP